MGIKSKFSIVSFMLVFLTGCHTTMTEESTDPELRTAEHLLDAFYSFDPVVLSRYLQAGDDADRLLYYQGWAEAANYRVKKRQACRRNNDGAIVCEVKVTDDFGKTMGYEATDTFTMQVQDDRISQIAFEGDDPPIFQALFGWIAANRPDILEGPCKNLFDGGTTPGPCARSVVVAARAFMLERSQQ